jgi:hypothetical protein
LNLQKSKNKKYIEILDAKGILVESYEIDGVISQFQFLPILNKGLYSLKVFSDDQVQILRLVKL